MTRYVVALIALLLLGFTPLSCAKTQYRFGSKKFTESVLLGEMLTQLARESEAEAVHFRELGGTQLVFAALRNGDIDAYIDYTGTIREEILAGRAAGDDQQIRAALREQGVLMSRPLGFNNTYALGMKADEAARLDISTISDLRRHPELKFGFSNEFIDRQDGWPMLRDEYDLPHRDVTGLDHDLAYRQLDAGAIDVIDAYTTDAKIKLYDLELLKDDLNRFPRYDAVLLYRADLADRAPEVVESLLHLEGTIDDKTMTGMNAETELTGIAESRVAADFLKERFGIAIEVSTETAASRVWKHTIEHLELVRRSLVPAILIAIPLGIVAAKWPAGGQIILATVGIIQTIPAFALLVMLMTPVHWLGLSSLGTGSVTAVAALFLYSLLPIVRNTYSGLHDIPNEIHESAEALGLPAAARLRLIELPLASRTILAGIKTAAVINVGFATLGALIGAGGYGQPILTGIRLNDNSLILLGAVPAALLALAVQGAFEIAERYCVPRGLRIKQS